MAKNKTTIDGLARMVQKGFNDVDQRFDRINDGINERFDKIEEWQKNVDERFAMIEFELLNIKKKLDNIIYRHEFEFLKDRVADLEKRLESFKKR